MIGKEVYLWDNMCFAGTSLEKKVDGPKTADIGGTVAEEVGDQVSGSHQK